MKQAIQTVNRPVQARVNIPGSKSMTNRALLLAALSNGVCEISGMLVSDDTRAFVMGLRELGIPVQLDESACSCIVGGGSGFFPVRRATIGCGNAGTVARFLMTACAFSPGEYSFEGSAQLQNRPLAPLITILCAQGARVHPKKAEKMPLTIKGADRMLGGEIEVDGSQTGQFISALLMIAPFAKLPVLIKTHNVVSRPFINMTCDMMRDFGVLVKKIHNARFSVPVPQRYIARDYVIEPDLSTASYFFAAAAVTGGQVTINPVDLKKSKQGDAVFLSILEKMGCHIIESHSGLSIKAPLELHGVNVDMRDCSDVFMTLAALAPFAKTPTAITNIGHTRFQESDRMKAMKEGLEKLKVKVEEGPDWLRIYPSKPEGAVIDSYQDHRIAMAFSIIGLRVPGVSIEGAECVTKTCPPFFEMWSHLDK